MSRRSVCGRPAGVGLRGFVRQGLFVISLCGCLYAVDEGVGSAGAGSTDARWMDVGSPDGVQFVDVAAEVGISLMNVSGDGEQQYVVDAFMGGSAFFDYDRDGDLDLYVLNGSRVGGFTDRDFPSNALYRNEGSMFSNATEESGLGDTRWGMGLAVADYDNDGDADVYVTNYGANALYENRGDGSFSDVAQHTGVVGLAPFSTGCAFFDADRDGDLDLYVANYLDFEHFMETTPDRRHEWRGLTVHFGPHGMKGAADVFYRNEGDGVFSDATAVAGMVESDLLYGLGVVAGDYDHDGDADVYVANDTGPNYLYENQGDGTFTDVAWMKGAAYGEGGESQGCMGIAFGDYDNDEYPDILVTNFWEETNTLYHNDGGQFFSDRTFDAGVGLESFQFLAWGTEFFDYDNDGDRDLFVANGHVYPQIDRANLGVRYAQTNQLFENVGDGTFAEVTQTSGAGLRIEKVSRGAAFGDYDEDGDLDIFVLELNDLPTLLRNDGGNRNNYLLVRMEGVASNRDGVGARVRLTCGSTTQIGEVRSGASYLSHNDSRLHFGLGECAIVDRLEVFWPSGLVETLENLLANRVLVIREGTGSIGPTAR